MQGFNSAKVVLAATIALSGAHAQAERYVNASTGVNVGDCTQLAAPCKTIIQLMRRWVWTMYASAECRIAMSRSALSPNRCSAWLRTIWIAPRSRSVYCAGIAGAVSR